jgi:hypothetical protein
MGVVNREVVAPSCQASTTRDATETTVRGQSVRIWMSWLARWSPRTPVRVSRRRTLGTSTWKCSKVYSSVRYRLWRERRWRGFGLRGPFQDVNTGGGVEHVPARHQLIVAALLGEHLGGGTVPMGGRQGVPAAAPLVQRLACLALGGAGLVELAEISVADAHVQTLPARFPMGG